MIYPPMPRYGNWRDQELKDREERRWLRFKAWLRAIFK
jgi:hypothetical protein